MVPQRVLTWVLAAALAAIAPAAGSAVASAAPPKLSPDRLERTGPKPPWPRRRLARGSRRATHQGLIDLSRWPAEPASPQDIAPDRFAEALRELCGWLPPKRRARYAEWILASSARFGVDPFLVAAAIYDGSRCRPKHRDDAGVGLGALQVGTHAGHIRKRRYRYWVLDGDSWRERVLPLPDHPFYGRSLELARPSIYFVAAFLKIFGEQCPDIDGAFGSVPHRHPVSHLVWGDKVLDAADEDRILTARRRLIGYYDGDGAAPTAGRWGELALRLPLDGAPRKISSAMGDARDGGARRHMGVDFVSTRGEPVRAVADGVVTLAGVDLKGAPSRNLTPEEADAVPAKDLALGGKMVMVRHAGGLTSCYMHLDGYVVQRTQEVKRGDLIGYVGRSGIKQSAAHLHFELRHDGHHIDPIPHLRGQVFTPGETWRGRRLEYEARRLRRRARRR